MKKSQPKYKSEHAERFSTLVNLLLKEKGKNGQPVIKNKSALARDLNSHASSINAILRGERDVTRDQLERFINTYPVNRDYLYKNEEPKWFNVEAGVVVPLEEYPLIAIRKAYNLTPKDLSVIAKTPEAQIKILEASKAEIPDKIKIALRYKLKISYNFMVEGRGDMIDESVPPIQVPNLRKAIFAATNVIKINTYNHHEAANEK